MAAEQIWSPLGWQGTVPTFPARGQGFPGDRFTWAGNRHTWLGGRLGRNPLAT